MKPSRSVPSPGYAASLELAAEPIVRAALLEDIGHGGDLTTDAIVDSSRSATARIVARRRRHHRRRADSVARLSLARRSHRTSSARIGEGERVGTGRDRRRDIGQREGDPHRRTHRAQSALPALRNCDRDAYARRPRLRDAREDRRYAQDDARPARAGAIRRRVRRREQSSFRFG